MILNSACDTNNNWNSRYKITLLILHISTAVYHQYFGNTCLLLSLRMSDELFTRRQVMIINRKQLRNLHYTRANIIPPGFDQSITHTTWRIIFWCRVYSKTYQCCREICSNPHESLEPVLLFDRQLRRNIDFPGKLPRDQV